MLNLSSLALRSLAMVRTALPVVGLAALSGYTWWLVQSMPSSQIDSPDALPSTQPDFRLAQARIERFSPDGQRLSMLQGQTMQHFEQGDRLVVGDLSWQSLGRQGDPTARQVQGQAREGQYRADDGMLSMHGQASVVVTQADGSVSTFTGEQLSWSESEQVLRADRPVQVVGPRGQIQAGSLVYEASSEQTVLAGRVRGSLQ